MRAHTAHPCPAWSAAACRTASSRASLTRLPLSSSRIDDGCSAPPRWASRSRSVRSTSPSIVKRFILSGEPASRPRSSCSPAYEVAPSITRAVDLVLSKKKCAGRAPSASGKKMAK
eukprot:scaffold5526_cov123-Isochrysis_galbana.AAC.4